ncbi:MAG: hypothetical protein WB714_05615 [Candidatus Sulfotelmatobacter sp.]
MKEFVMPYIRAHRSKWGPFEYSMCIVLCAGVGAALLFFFQVVGPDLLDFVSHYQTFH